jgi:peptidyl-prolyl cis-trans isomerase B (cyclophilin B)
MLVILVSISLIGCNAGPAKVNIKTPMGDIVVELYDSTPEHKKNFIKLVDENFFDSLLFHRVIGGFMVQGGDPASRNAAPNSRLGAGGPGYTVPAEIGAPHFKGTLAAARQGDAVNPRRESSGSQFYVVHGNPVSEQMLNNFERQFGLKYNETQRQKYLEVGGTPQLDGQYTVFGEVVKGLDVIDKIAAVRTNSDNRPLEDVWMVITR